MDGLRARLQQRLDKLGLSPRAASLRAGMGATAIRDIFRRPDTSPGVDTIERIARVLETTPEWLAYEAGEPDATSVKAGELLPANDAFSFARVDGVIAAGNWLDTDLYGGEDESTVISAPRDPMFPYARQIAYLIGGDSMNLLKPKPVREGDYVVCANFEDTGLKPTDGMVVSVQRTRDGGQIRERSLKQVFVYEDRTEFVPQSDNPAHKPIVVPKGGADDEATQVEILGLLRFIFDNQPVPIPSLKRSRG